MIKLLTDTASDLTLAQTDAAGIGMLCLTLRIEGDAYLEQHDLSKDELLERLEHSDIIPEAEAVSVFSFEEAFRHCLVDGFTDIVYVSQSGSQSYANAQAARDALYVDYPDSKEKMTIHILDSGSYSMGYGYPLLQAARMVREGMEIGALLDYLENWFANAGLYFVPMTTKYLKKSACFGSASLFAGELLGLKPMVHVSHGTISVCDKLRPEKQLVTRMTERITEVIQSGSPYVILHGTSMEYVEPLASVLTEKLGYPPADVVRIGSSVAIHAGYDLTAVVLLEQQS